MPTPPPTAFPCILPIINLGHFLQALITPAKPEKKRFPVAISSIAISSLKLAPAQNVRLPPLFKMRTLISSLTQIREIWRYGEIGLL